MFLRTRKIQNTFKNNSEKAQKKNKSHLSRF